MTAKRKNNNESVGREDRKRPRCVRASTIHDEKARIQSSVRSIEADLKVIVGNDTDGNRQEFWHYSATLASQSRYVDMILFHNKDSSDNYKEIHFPDIRPQEWLRMMKLIEDPLALRALSSNEAMELVIHYDKYDIPSGIKICDETISSIYKEQNDHTVDQRVEALTLCDHIYLRKTYHWGRLWIYNVFHNFATAPGEYFCFPLTKDHFKELIPVILKDSELPTIESLGLGVEPFDAHQHIEGGRENVTFLLQTQILSFASDCYTGSRSDVASIFDMTNPLFTDIFYASIELRCAAFFARKGASNLVITFDEQNHPAMGTYKLIHDTYFHTSYNTVTLCKCRETREWQLVHEGRVLYRCKNSQFAPVPPTSGWVSFHGDNLPQLRLQILSC